MELILDADIILELCLPGNPGHAITRKAIEHARGQGFTIWALAADARWLLERLAGQLPGTNPANRHQAAALLTDTTRGFQWLAALADEGELFSHPDPELERLRRCLARLTGTPGVMTRAPEKLRTLTQAVTPEGFLELPVVSQPIAFVDLAAQQHRMRPTLERNLHQVLHHGGYIMGPEVGHLERALSAFAGMRHALSCASGTDALQLAMMAMGIGVGDAVFVPAFTFMASAETVSLLGAEPCFVDIDPHTFNMDPSALEQEIARCLREGRLTPRCVMPVDLFGLPADYTAIRQICDHYRLTLLADSAQGFGSTCNGIPACRLADITATSFFPAKPLGCYGDGGALFTDQDDLAARIISLRLHGKGQDKYDNVRIGINSRLDTLQAAILLAKLPLFPQELQQRRRVANHYNTRLATTSTITTPVVPTGLESAWAQYGILTDQRDALEKQLKKHQIPTAIYYPRPLPFQTAYACQQHQPGRFPVAETVSRRILHLPMHPYLTPDTLDHICNTINTACREVER